MAEKSRAVLTLLMAIGMGCGASDTHSNTGESLPVEVLAGCGATWNVYVTYREGEIVSYKTMNFAATYWNHGKNPLTFSGAPGSGQPWMVKGACRQSAA